MDYDMINDGMDVDSEMLDATPVSVSHGIATFPRRRDEFTPQSINGSTFSVESRPDPGLNQSLTGSRHDTDNAAPSLPSQPPIGSTTIGPLPPLPPKAKLGRPPKIRFIPPVAPPPPTNSTGTLTTTRRLGRPRGSGPKQKARAEQLARGDIPESATKRSVGRPRKIQQAPKGLGVTVKQIKGKILIPGTKPLTRTLSAPAGLPQANPTHSESSGGRGIIQPGAQRGKSTPVSLQESSKLVPQPPTACIPPTPPPPHPPQQTSTACAPSFTACPIILPEDPQRPIDLDDDENEGPEVLGDGLGWEGDPLAPDEVEWDPSEGKDGNEGSGSSSGSQRAIPVWLMRSFNAKLAESAKRNTTGLPPLYSQLNTIWFPCPTLALLLHCHPNIHLSPQVIFERLTQFVLWDPEPLNIGGIPCPNCRRRLNRAGHISRPRRIVDVDEAFYLIGFRYRCPECIHPISKKKTVTFASWDSRILAQLSNELVADFPAHLSHRSGISRALFEWMRLCFQNGMGAKQFSDALRVQHLLKYEELRLQYLEALACRSKIDVWCSRIYEDFPLFESATPQGHYGFVPGAYWVRNMYDQFIESHRDEMNQHTSMLTADICAVDHSHKITKHIARVYGEPVFTALLTITNQLGEIRSCNLVATKSHAQYQEALNQMSHSLDLYGHPQPSLFFTDSMADKQFLEQSFPSLLEEVTPVEKYATLEPLVIPEDVIISVKNSASAINDAMRTIINDLPPDDPNAKIVVGFDSEWNVEVSQQESVVQRGKTAIIQIAYQNRVYVLQIADMISSGHLPRQLLILLSHPNILKAGRLVKADLKFLEKSCCPPRPFVGDLDLAAFAKARHVISSAKCSLSDLCAIVLNKRLNKNVPERISSTWENNILTEGQLKYAACDAYTCLLVYNKLSDITVPQPLPENPIPGTPLLLYSSDNSMVVGHGRISAPFQDNTFDGINITKTRILVDVHKVLVPGAVITSHRNRSLESFGIVPFHVVYLRSHVRVFSPPTWPHLSNLEVTNPQSKHQSNQSLQPTRAGPLDEGLILEPNLDESGFGIDDGPSFGDIITETQCAADLPPLPVDYPKVLDQESLDQGAETLGLSPENWDTTICSRVLKDAFHVFNMLRLSSAHGLRLEFGRTLRDAIFIPDAEDRRRITAWGAVQSPPQSFDQIRASRPAWLWRRCRRIIPPPKILYPLVKKVFQTFGPLTDATTGVPLFNSSNWKTAKNILDLIQNGFLSDPPGITLYTVIGVDQKAGGLPVYRCARGTNFTEGGVHSHLRSHLPSSGASIRHVHACLQDFVLRHNLLVGTYNTSGHHYRGHFSIWITNKIQERLVYLQDVLVHPVQITGWINGNLYIRSKEVLGILPIPPEIQAESGITPYIPSLDAQQKHTFLAEMQQTHKPVLPIHNPVEKELFNKLMQSNSDYNSDNGPNWKQAVKIWNSYANVNTEIYYKLIEQLKSYYTEWKTRLNVRESLTLTFNERQPLKTTLNNPRRSTAAPRIPAKKCQPTPVKAAGLDLSHIPATDHRHDESMDAREASTNVMSTSSAIIDTPAPSVDAVSLANQVAHSRVTENLAQSQDEPVAKERKRSCRKCGLRSCPGRKEVVLCTNRCRDCGKVRCLGRNPKRPARTCHTAWDDKKKKK